MGHHIRRALACALLLAPVSVAPLAPAGGGPVAEGIDDTVRLNQVQVVGSHNSYHVEASRAESDLRRQFIGDEENALQYGHAPLDQQFSEQKVRQIELDVFNDSQGGRYADPLIRSATGGGPYDPAMNEPGIKVLHVQDVDYRTSCLSLVACLDTVDAWSDANPTHLPIAILVELKDSPLDLGDFDFVEPEPFDAAALDGLDAEIRSVFDEDEMITPDDVRGGAATLEEAVLAGGWPTLADSRGQVLFLMDNGEPYRSRYLDGHPSLEGRVAFTNAQPGQADAAFVKVNEAIGNVERIQGLVADGYVVRTRSDSDTEQARTGDTTTRDAAFASGAQWVSTDYPVASYAQRFGTDYVVEMPGGTVARCNPVNAPPACIDALLDTILPPGPPPPPDPQLPPPPSTPSPSVEPSPSVADPAVPVAAPARFTG